MPWCVSSLKRTLRIRYMSSSRSQSFQSNLMNLLENKIKTEYLFLSYCSLLIKTLKTTLNIFNKNIMYWGNFLFNK